MTQHDNSSTGRWTSEQHQKFLLGIQIYGKNWKKIQEMIVTRTCAQIRSHAQKYFLKLKKQNKDLHSIRQEQSHNEQSSDPIQNSTGNSKQQDQSSYSYFMNKILQYTRTHQQFDLWSALIDNGGHKETVADLDDKHAESEIVNENGEDKKNTDQLKVSASFNKI